MEYQSDNLTQQDFDVLIRFGYIVETEKGHTIIFEKDSDSKVKNEGLIVGLTQNNDIVDAYFLGPQFEKEANIKFEKEYIFLNNKKYYYNDLGINLQIDHGFIIDKDDNKLFPLSDDAFRMFASVYGIQDNHKCVISVLNGDVCACCISGEDVLWISKINLGENNFNETDKTIKVGNETYSLEDCYLRVCMKNIYLHVDVENKSRIIGKANNQFYDNN